MNDRVDAARAASARAIDRVLLAERQAEAALAQARDDAHREVERARDDGRAIVNRALERVGRWQAGHAAALQRRLQVLQVQARQAADTAPAADPTARQAAIDRVAAMLTGARDGQP